MKNCKGDFAELRPTLMAGVPLVYDKVKKGIEDKIANSPAAVRLAFKVAFKYKIFFSEFFGLPTPLVNRLIFNQFKSALGGRCRLIITGGAGLSPEVQQFLQTCFSVPVLQGYGLTETCGASNVMEITDITRKCIGPPVPCCEVAIRDVPDMDYSISSNPPRGEILIRGANVSSGYFKSPEKS